MLTPQSSLIQTPLLHIPSDPFPRVAHTMGAAKPFEVLGHSGNFEDRMMKPDEQSFAARIRMMLI